MVAEEMAQSECSNTRGSSFSSGCTSCSEEGTTQSECSHKRASTWFRRSTFSLKDETTQSSTWFSKSTSCNEEKTTQSEHSQKRASTWFRRSMSSSEEKTTQSERSQKRASTWFSKSTSCNEDKQEAEWSANVAGRFLDRRLHATGSSWALDVLILEYLPQIRDALGLSIPVRRIPLAFRMILNQSRDEGRYQQPLHTLKAYEADPAFLATALGMARYAASAYATGASAICERVGTKQVTLHQDTAFLQPNFFLARDPFGTLVLTLRGTATVSDGLTTVLFKPTWSEQLQQKVHTGVLRMAQNVVEQAAASIDQALLEDPELQIVLVGHSLGAAVAMVATLLLFGPSSRHYQKMQRREVRCFAYGPPPAFSTPEQLPESARSSLITFINGFDVVPTASPQALGKLLLALEEVYKTPGVGRNFTGRIRRLRGRTKTYHLSDVVEMKPEQRERQISEGGDYKHAGLVLLLHKSSGYPTALDEVQEIEDQCVIHENMLSDHMMGAYKQRLRELLETAR